MNNIYLLPNVFFYSSKPIGFIVAYDWFLDALLIVLTMHQHVFCLFDCPFDRPLNALLIGF